MLPVGMIKELITWSLAVFLSKYVEKDVENFDLTN
jgi:hypothetical protein